VITAALVKTHERDSGTKMGVADGGLPSRTSYRALAATGGFSRVSVQIHTGRTHQVRVHMAHLGCPIVGDSRYGDKERDARLFADARRLRRLYLHAHSLRFTHPLTNTAVDLLSAPPEPFSRLWDTVGGA
jgi:23S rRNA pseudouridine955/2504/2580 synthase